MKGILKTENNEINDAEHTSNANKKSNENKQTNKKCMSHLQGHRETDGELFVLIGSVK